MIDCIKDLAGVKVHNIHSTPLFHTTGHPGRSAPSTSRDLGEATWDPPFCPSWKWLWNLCFLCPQEPLPFKTVVRSQSSSTSPAGHHSESATNSLTNLTNTSDTSIKYAQPSALPPCSVLFKPTLIQANEKVFATKFAFHNMVKYTICYSTSAFPNTYVANTGFKGSSMY